MAFKRWEGTHRPVHAAQANARLKLAADLEAPAAARRAVDGLANGYHAEALADAQLLVTELVTNAIRHGGGGEVDVSFWLDGAALDVEVTDDGPAFMPHERVLDADPIEGGLGLEMIDTFAESWGSSADSPCSVWFRLAMRPGEKTIRARAPAPDLLDVRRVVDSVTQYAMVALDPGGRVTSWSPGAERLTGYAAAEFLGRPLQDLYELDSSGPIESGVSDAAAGLEVEIECWLLHADGSHLWVNTALAPVRDGDGGTRALSGVIADHTAQRQTDEDRERLIDELRDLSLTDELTRLANRRGWSQALERELVRARRDGKILTIVMLDLNGFKSFNDTRGHVEGDKLLVSLSKAWSEPMRATDTLARYGGDEFALILPHCEAGEAFAVVDRMHTLMPEAIDFAAGLVSTEGTESPEALTRRADAALYEAKRRRERAVFITAD